MMIAASIVPVIALRPVVWQCFFFVTELGPPAPFLPGDDHDRDRAENGHEEPEPSLNVKSEELCWLHREQSLGR